MSVLSSTQVLRPGPKGLKRWFMARAMAALPFVFRVLRWLKPIPRFGKDLCRHPLRRCV